MRPLGKTYLIEIPEQKDEILEGGIIMPKEKKSNLVHYRGIVKEIGLGFNNDNIVQKGQAVLFDWKQKAGKVKIFLGKDMFYVVEEDLILAIEE